MQKKLVSTILLLLVVAFCVLYLVKKPDHILLFLIILAYCWLHFRERG